jgi:hypothetical protein
LLAETGRELSRSKKKAENYGAQTHQLSLHSYHQFSCVMSKKSGKPAASMNMPTQDCQATRLRGSLTRALPSGPLSAAWRRAAVTPAGFLIEGLMEAEHGGCE